jgi:hypothetical protein
MACYIVFNFKKGGFMFSKVSRGHVLPFFLSACMAFPVMSQAQNLKHKAGFNLNWKFYKGDAGTGAAGTGYNDASWAVVNIPHSPSYDAATPTGEASYYVGTCWYRKSFTLPANVKLAFMEFEGAMQVCTLYVNGTKIGFHNNSGYTPFVFNISNQVVRGGSNVVALYLNNVRSADIPPGWASAGPDYYLFGGLNRPVWLHFKDSVYIPVYQQQVMTINVSASSGQVRAKTPVRNAHASSQSVQVTVNLLNASQTQVSTLTSTLTIPANTLDTFDMTLPAVSGSNFSLWSPSTPNMYSVQTLVRVGGIVVDSVVEPCGFRWFSWSTSTGFSLNGARMEIHGMCLHQNLGWIENAIPDWRYYYEVKVIKGMGANSIRCSHYPRAQAFYNACDKIGMLCYPEQPSWGWSMNPSAACWAKMDSCVREMVLSARNHPSIYLWGLYNEPNVTSSPQDYTSYITTMNNHAHSLDSTRLTSEANNGTPSCGTVPDVFGMNYATSTNYTSNGKSSASMPWINFESRNTGTFGTQCSRGSALDLDTTDVQNSAGNDALEWASFNFTTATSGQLSGGHFWEFKDHFSTWNTSAYEGVADNMDIPKTMYHYFAKRWNSAYVTDYPRPGTSTKLDFKVDTNSLPADSVNVFLLTAGLRDNNNHLISSACQVQFTLSDPTKGIIFGGNTVTALGGLAAAYLRTSKSPGTFTVTATALCNTSLTQTLTLTTTPVSESYMETGVKPFAVQAKVEAQMLKVTHATNGIIFHCPQSAGHLRVIDCQGRTIYSQDALSGASLLVSRHTLGAGLFYGVWEDGKQRLVSRVMNVIMQ